MLSTSRYTDPSAEMEGIAMSLHRTTVVSLILMCVLMVSGCGRAERAEIEKTRLDLEKARTEIAALNAKVTELSKQATEKAYLEELEKLSSLMQKNVLTQEEFDRRKQAILAGQKQAPVVRPAATTGMDELAEQLRTLHSLYSSSTITSNERDAKRTMLIQQAGRATDLKKDLQTAQSLYSSSVITSADHEILKQKLLGLDKDGHEHH